MQVKIFIRKKIHQDYLNYLFEYDKINGTYNVNRTHDFGKLITARVQYNSTPVKIIGENLINFKLPLSRPLANAPNYYLYFTQEDQHKLNDGLEVLFNIDFDSFYLQGKKLKMQQKDIIQSFIISRKLVSLIGDNETLKKRQYRDELFMQKKYAQMLTSIAYERHEKIEKCLKSHN